MIQYNPKSWYKLIFALHKSDTIRIMWKELIYISIFTSLIAFIEIEVWPAPDASEELISVYSLIGFVISLLLVFRTNTAYDRWWEGRKRWGAMVNDTRNVAVKINALTKDSDDRDFFKRMIPNFVFATKEHLRDGVIMEELELTPEEAKHLERRDHVPAAVVGMMYDRLQTYKERGIMTEAEYLTLDRNLNAFLDSLGACERIKNTPIPFSYSLFLKKFIFIYVATLPLAFVNIFGYWSALIATFVFYVLVSMEVLAEEIEDPFGTDDNDLPTQSISERIRMNVTEILT